MKRKTTIPVLLSTLLLLTVVFAAARAGDHRAETPTTMVEAAPDFTLKSTSGEAITLSELRGKYVVLEWLNFGCPYVGKHYGSDNMQRLQEAYTKKGVVWLSVVTSSRQTPEQLDAEKAKRSGKQTTILLDPDGKVGRLYGARTTPHMFVIGPEGELFYKGGIDDKPTANAADVAGATNYVAAALDAAMSGKEVGVKAAPPYGCAVKY